MIDLSHYSDSLRLDADGIWQSTAPAETISYPEDGNDLHASLEDHSFWFKHRNDCIAAAVTRFPPPGPIFDIGGGNGFVARGLSGRGHDVALVEPGPGAHHAKRRGLETVVHASMDAASFRPESIPAIGLFDVLEHINDDLAFLRSIRRALGRGGRVYLTVPAHMFLWSSEDVIAGHFRRYTIPSVSNVIERAGFEIEFASYFFRVLVAPIALFRALPYRVGIRRYATDGRRMARDHSPPVASVLAPLLENEGRRIEHGASVSNGTSCLIVARRS